MLSAVRTSHKLLRGTEICSTRFLSISGAYNDKHSCKFLVIGGGTAGCAMASKLAHNFTSDSIIVLEPNERHYYQPLFTLIGAGVKTLKSSYRDMKDVLPKKAKWLRDSAVMFKPNNNEVVSEKHVIDYEYLVISAGMQLNYNAIPGLEEALNDDDSNVCSIYSPKYVNKTWDCIKSFKGGNAIFTFPNTPVKCPGAPQKIMYLAEDNFRHRNIHTKANITYNTSLPVIFGVKKYADALWKVCKERGIHVNLRRNLIGVDSKAKQATFQNLDDPDEKFTYDLLHVAPPMGPTKALLSAAALTNAAGFVDVNKSTLQHVKYSNIFALGDCTNSPNSKTAAAVAAQSNVLLHNLKNFIDKKVLDGIYTGYASCPLVTSYNKCILAEFDYDLKPTETFAFNQAKERRSMYYMKKDAMPILYWNLMTSGHWNGPELMRKIFNPLKSD